MANPANILKLLDPEIRAKNLDAIRLNARGLWWSLRRPYIPDPVFVVGCSRSGTTVTYETLAASPAFMSFGYEIPQFWNSLHGPLNNGWDSEAAGADVARPEYRDAAFRYFYQQLGTGLLLDKTCINTMRVPFLHRLFPRARFVYLHRNGYDNISSMMDGWRKGRTDGGFGLTQFFGPSPEPVAINGGEFREWHFFLPPGWREYNHASLEEVCAFQWTSANRMALDAARTIPREQWVQVRYEDIVDDPVGTFRGIFQHLAVNFDEDIQDRCASLHQHPTSMVSGPPRRQKWREQNPQAIQRIANRIRPMMLELGYDTGI
ncbi:MAG: sulfotransferase [Gammaproteobacteria bacterium]|nr:sulfotransferase [Gammaproteobacteria bacterium]